MKNILKISIAALASAALLSGCIKETFPTDRATSDQLAGSASALEAMVKGIPTALIQVKSLTDYGNMHWNFSLPAIHLATDSAAGDMAITGDTGYDWFSQWGANDALAENYAANLLTWNNYFTWIKSTNDIISTIDPEALTTPSISSASLMLTGLRSTSTWYVSMSSRRINTRPQTECSALPYRS